MGLACLPALECIRGQLEAFDSELQRMHGLEFPYDHSRQAVHAVHQTCKKVRRYIASLNANSDPSTVASFCKTAIGYLEDSLRILGFILRSTNVRNAFEVHGPMLRLTKKILGPTAKLLLSSEWEISPFLLLGSRVLPPEYVLIGQPASESANPFLLPLAGHELGHSVWAHRKLQAMYDKKAKAQISTGLQKRWGETKRYFSLTCKPEDLENDLNGNAILSQAVEWCCRQLEESFCDSFGVRIFGPSYFYAFAYLLAPLVAPIRTPIYPDFRDRATLQVDAAVKFGYEPPDHYVDLFEHSPLGFAGAESFLLEVVDEVRRSLMGEVIDEVQAIAKNAMLPEASREGTQNCVATLKHFVPCLGAKCVADITNAAWAARLATPFFAAEHLEERKIEHLSELVLKSIEVFEIEQCLIDQRTSPLTGVAI